MTSQRYQVGHMGGWGLAMAVILALGVLLVAGGSALAQAAGKDKKDDDRGEVILSNLPARG